ncbi:MAG: hypothetical protein CMF80_06915 [Candidatus Marinimicrobia bacterium]|nr:hypothetical protein [Candidatus Neomarinimicrobiota bacterium]|tara:strand:+ start:4161 stop:4451 length:291 start_codon:yes stop_codon:yes gene_type:complete
MKDEEIIGIIGLLGSLGVGASLFPQTCKIWESNDVGSISPSFIIITTSSSVLMLIYATYFLVYPMIIANLSVFGNCCILLFFYCRTKTGCRTMMWA